MHAFGLGRLCVCVCGGGGGLKVLMEVLNRLWKGRMGFIVEGVIISGEEVSVE